jgi:hypothetical protein
MRSKKRVSMSGDAARKSACATSADDYLQRQTLPFSGWSIQDP